MLSDKGREEIAKWQWPLTGDNKPPGMMSDLGLLQGRIEALRDPDKAIDEQVTISDPQRCPFVFLPVRSESDTVPSRCDKCRSTGGVFIVYNVYAGWKRQFDTSTCLHSQGRKQKAMEHLLRDSGLTAIEQHHTLARADRDENTADLIDWLNCWEPKEGKPPYFYALTCEGNPKGLGTGKSFYLHALAIRIMTFGIQPFVLSMSTFLNYVRKSTQRNDAAAEAEREVMRIAGVAYLCLDDVGADYTNPAFLTEHVYNLIESRERKGLPIAYASPYPINIAAERVGGRAHGQPIASRIGGSCVEWGLAGPDRRAG